MKILVITLFAIFAVVSADFEVKTHENLMQYRGQCVQELSVPENLIEEYKKWNFPSDEKTKCYIKCVFNKMDLFHDDVGPVVDNLVLQLKREDSVIDDLRAEIIKCVDANPDKDDNCAWAYRGFICFNKAHLDVIQASVKKD